MVATHLMIPEESIADFCRRHHIRKLAFFGSVLRDDFRSDSDVDVLVDFAPQHIPDFLALYEMEQELSAMLGHRRIDLVTEKSLHHLLREPVLATAKVQYAQG
jgi:predicted nucleotidyltransferase